jgi:transcriptional regulator with XRE-family HTH domain
MAGTSGSGSPRARVLGAWMRDARDKAGFGVREAARAAGIEHATLSRWETAARTPRPQDVAVVLTAVGAPADERDRLVQFAESATSETNWVTVGDPSVSEALIALIEFEQMAKRITDWSMAVIPGLLQTGDYVRAIFKDSGKPAAQTAPRVSARLSRRDVLTRVAPVEFRAVLGEEALRQVVGGPQVMADQLRHLLEFAELPNVTLQVLPTGHGWHAGIPGAFELLEYETARPIVHLEHLRSSLFLYQSESDLQAYKDAAVTLRDLALKPAQSAEFIARRKTELEAIA